MNRTRRLNLSRFLVAILIFFFPMIVFWILNRPIYVWIELLLVLACMLKYKKLYPVKYATINCIFLSIGFSVISALMGNLPTENQKAAVVQTIYAIIAYLAVSYVFHMIKRDSLGTISIIAKAFKAMVLVELFWIPLQYICYHVLSLDINELIFVDALHMVENASFIRSWIWYPSGLSWHSALLAPMFVIGLFVFNEPWIRILIIAESFMCGNSTTLVGTILTTILILGASFNKKKKIKIRTVAIGLFALIVYGFLAYRFGMFEKIQEQATFTITRMFLGGRDDSTSAHLGYFTDYFDVAKQSSVLQLIFGYGEGCSGYPIWILNGRTTDLQSWSVECDFIDLLIGRGIFGFIAFYTFLLSIAFKGYKVDKKYMMAIIVIMIEGLGYNVQWAYMFFMELIFAKCINMKLSFFEIALNTKIFKGSKVEYGAKSVRDYNYIQSNLG